MRETQSDQRKSLFRAERQATRGTSVPVFFLVGAVMWIFNILPDRFTAHVSRCADKIAACPQRRQSKQLRELSTEKTTRAPLERFDYEVWSVSRFDSHK